MSSRAYAWVFCPSLFSPFFKLPLAEVPSLIVLLYSPALFFFYCHSFLDLIASAKVNLPRLIADSGIVNFDFVAEPHRIRAQLCEIVLKWFESYYAVAILGDLFYSPSHMRSNVQT